MVSLAQTSRKYRGKTAAGYEAKRRKQIRWDRENKIVERMLDGCSGALLDVPVGTGRFLRLYEKLGIGPVNGVDSSDDMLRLAAKKRTGTSLEPGDATSLRFDDKVFWTSVCVRFLDLIDEESMQLVVRELCRVTKERIICTIRLGRRYVPKSNTAEHDERKFLRLVSLLGWRVADRIPIFKAGWNVLRLERKP